MNSTDPCPGPQVFFDHCTCVALKSDDDDDDDDDDGGGGGGGCTAYIYIYIYIHTPLQFIIALAKQWLEDYFPIEKVVFSGVMLNFRGVHTHSLVSLMIGLMTLAKDSDLR